MKCNKIYKSVKLIKYHSHVYHANVHMQSTYEIDDNLNAYSNYCK